MKLFYQRPAGIGEIALRQCFLGAEDIEDFVPPLVQMIMLMEDMIAEAGAVNQWMPSIVDLAKKSSACRMNCGLGNAHQAAVFDLVEHGRIIARRLGMLPKP